MAGGRDGLEFGDGDGGYIRWMESKRKEKPGAELARRARGGLASFRPEAGGRGEGDG